MQILQLNNREGVTMKTQKGFTLIELVMVIVILGILAAVAIPKFADLTSRAEISAENGIVGGLRSALSVYASDKVADGAPQAQWYPGNPFDSVQDWPSTYDTTATGAPTLGTDTDVWQVDAKDTTTQIYHAWKDGITVHVWTYDNTTGTIAIDSSDAAWAP